MSNHKCKRCNAVSSAEEWNDVTASSCDEEITKIEDEDADMAFFVCPGCKHLCEPHERENIGSALI